MPQVPTNNVVPLQQPTQQQPEPTYLMMAAAQMHQEGKLTESDDDYYARIEKEWTEMPATSLRAIARDDVERNVMSPPKWRFEEYMNLWKEEKEFGEKSWQLSPKQLHERYGSGARRPR